MADDAALDVMSEEERLSYEMTNLYPRDTGLPMTVWIGPKSGARHDVRVKVHQRHGDRMDPLNTASVAVRPEPRLVQGRLDSDDLRQVIAWIELNRDVIVDFWEGVASAREMAARLQDV